MEARRKGGLPQEPRSTSRAPSRPLASPAARWSRSTGSNGSGSPTRRRRSTRCSPARSTSSRRRRTICSRCWSRRRQHQDSWSLRWAASTPSASTRCTSPSTMPRCARRCPTRSTRRTSSSRPSAMPSTTGVQVALSCGSPLETEQGLGGQARHRNFAKAKALLAEAGYDGTPVVLMQSTDVARARNLAPVAKSLMEKAGFKVDLQAMDWQTLVSRRAKKDPLASGGWSVFLTSWAASTCSIRSRPTSSTPAATRRRSAGPATPSSSGCATPSPRRPIPPSRRRSPRPCQVRAIEYHHPYPPRPVPDPVARPQEHHRPPRRLPPPCSGTSRRR